MSDKLLGAKGWHLQNASVAITDAKRLLTRTVDRSNSIGGTQPNKVESNSSVMDSMGSMNSEVAGGGINSSMVVSGVCGRAEAIEFTDPPNSKTQTCFRENRKIIARLEFRRHALTTSTAPLRVPLLVHDV